jgi:hypothetical protein
LIGYGRSDNQTLACNYQFPSKNGIRLAEAEMETLHDEYSKVNVVTVRHLMMSEGIRCGLYLGWYERIYNFHPGGIRLVSCGTGKVKVGEA